MPPSHLTLTGAELPQAKKTCLYACKVALIWYNSLRPCGLWPVRLLCQGFLQERILECIGQYWLHTSLEHYISCCPSHQCPRVPGAARTPVTQAAAPPPHLALTGADPGPYRQPQEQTPVDDPHAEVEIKPQLKPRSSVTKEEDPNLPTAVQAGD